VTRYRLLLPSEVPGSTDTSGLESGFGVWLVVQLLKGDQAYLRSGQAIAASRSPPQHLKTEPPQSAAPGNLTGRLTGNLHMHQAGSRPEHASNSTPGSPALTIAQENRA